MEMRHILHSDADNTFTVWTSMAIAKALAPGAAREDQAC